MVKIRVNSYSVQLPNLPEVFDGYRILHLSDIHLGRGPDQRDKILSIVRRESADLLVITGDLLHDEKNTDQGPVFIAELEKTVKIRDGLFGVFGNHDLFLQKQGYADLRFRWLDNSCVRIDRGNEKGLSLIGLNQKEWSAMSYLEAMRGVEPGDIKIVLAHYPSTIYLLNGRVDLVLSGHTHAGQIRIPGLPCETNDDIDWRISSGLSQVGKTKLLVSSGIGYSGPFNQRFFAPSEIGIITLRCP
jgi:predicted MPP superfamily phosphohydrolase